VVSALARTRMVVGWASMCAAAVTAPGLFALLGVEACVALAGGLLVAAALWAYLKLR
jgi:hypothetical protein